MKSKKFSRPAATAQSTPVTQPAPETQRPPVSSPPAASAPAATPSALATRPSPSREQIAALAHAIWFDRGCPEGSDLDHWLEAERQLRGEHRARLAADELPASDEALDPSHSLEGKVERELDRVGSTPKQRGPTSL